ncbi:hypothetical protein VaNZ11_013261 [Volvox africanus]|uniref:Uncharacterized protein n=1 Tax=Volvox africanus TaxID=51714 RepID=A0ABQ5SFY0_9CHLO|nr:hypothetical protein VaNZ11_013261 [Volvox africanus]
MARQRRLIQIARRMMPLTGKGHALSTDWEKRREQANKLIYRKHGIPNAVQLGHTLATHTSLSGKDRVRPGSQMTWPGLPANSPAGVCRGGIIEVCSPGQLCRDVAAQMALAEARTGSVLWMAVGPQAVGFSNAVLREVPNMSLQQRVISIAADSKSALQELLRLVRQQTYTMVVLDHVAGLAPPPTSWAIPPDPAAHPQALPAVPAAAAARGAAAATTTTKTRTGSEATGTRSRVVAAEDLVGKLGAAVLEGTAAPAALMQAHHPHPHYHHHYHHHYHYQHDHLYQGSAGVPTDAGFCHPAIPSPGGGSAVLNLKFLLNVLPLLIEETLGELAASCGPDLRTTTLLLNSYAWRERARAASAAGLGADGGGRSRWARRAILRHAAATLHVTPESGGETTAAVPGAVGPAGAPGGQGPVRCLRAVLSKSLPTGEDGDRLCTWSLNTPIRLVSPPWDDG